MSDFALNVITNIEKFQRDFAQLPGYTEKMAARAAEKLAYQMAKGQAKAAEAAESAATRAAKAWDHAADKSGQLGSSAAKLGGILDMIAPGAGDVARGFNDMADGAEVAATAAKGVGLSMSTTLAVLGPLALALAGVAYAYHEVSKKAEAAEAWVERQAAAATKAQAENERLRSMTQRLTDQELVSTGKATDADLKLRDAIKSVTAEYAPRVAAEEREIARLRLLMTTSGAVADREKIGSEARTKAVATYNESVLAVHRHEAALASLKTEQGRYLQSAARGVILGKSDEKQHTQTAKAVKQEAAAVDEAAKASEAFEKLQADFQAAYHKRREQSAAALAQLEGDAHEQAIQRMNDADRVRAKLEDEIRAREALLETAAKGSGEEQKRALDAFESWRVDRVAQAEDEIAALQKAGAEKSTSRFQEATQAVASFVTQGMSAIASGLEKAQQYATNQVGALMAYQAQVDQYLTASQSKELDRRVAAQKRAARSAFRAQQAAAAASAVVDTAAAFANALRAAPPPVNFILAGANAAAGAIQVGTILSTQPTFHKGGRVTGGPSGSAARRALQTDEVPSVLQEDEWVSTSQGRSVLGDATLRRADAGIPPAGGTILSINAYGHDRVVSSWERDRLRGYTPLAAAVSGTTPSGHRSSRHG